MSEAAIEKGKKLIHLYRRGIGGERANAGRLLLTHLRTHDLTLYDLDRSLPVSQDVTLLDNWRESAALLTKLGTAEQDEVLTQLVDASDLNDAEIQKVLKAIDLSKLIEVRLDGWAYAQGHSVDELRQAAQNVQTNDLLGLKGSLAERMLEATLRRHYFITHPERLIRADNLMRQQFTLGVLEAMTGHPATVIPEGVKAHLNVEQLAKARALLAQFGPQAEQTALQAAKNFGEKIGKT